MNYYNGQKILLYIIKNTTQNYQSASLNCGKYYFSKKKNITLICTTILLKKCEKYYFNKNQILLWLIKNTTLASFATWKHNDNFLCCEKYYYSIACATTILDIAQRGQLLVVRNQI